MDATKERVNMLFLSFVSEKWRKLLTPIAAAAVIAAILFFPRGQADTNEFVMSGENPFPEETASLIEPEKEEIIVNNDPLPLFVDVKGAVRHPGVYSLNEGDRLIDAITAAGGYLPEAESRSLNHAMKVVDELSIYVPVVGEEPFEMVSSVGETNSAQQVEGRVNINNADETLLRTIPGIGPSKAASIIQYRLDHGPFKKPEELMEVSGIGQKTFDKLEEKITVD